MKKKKGFILPAVILVFVLLMIIVPVMVKWVQNDTKLSVKDQKTSIAFNLAEAALDRGYWKVKSSTATCDRSINGAPIPGYNFDVVYTDVPGGSYRISISSSGVKTIKIVGEGRDKSTNEVRAIAAEYTNQTIYTPLLSSGNLGFKKGLVVFWGAIMALGDITLDPVLADHYFPRKFAKGVVIGAGSDPRDTNGLTGPNTGNNGEWTSDYEYVPELPIPNFEALKSSAIASHTYNVYGCAESATHTDAATGNVVAGPAPWDARNKCQSNGDPHPAHFGNPWGHPKSAKNQPNTDYVWYYDANGGHNGDLRIIGDSTNGCGLRGTLIVRGNLTIDSPGQYNYTGAVPANAYAEHKQIDKTHWDTAATKQYPADIGLSSSAATFRFGTDTWSDPWGNNWKNTVGMRGFTYVGGNLNLPNTNSFMDFNGAVWVVGDVISSGGSANAYCGIFYNDKLDLPTLNVILMRKYWTEVKPSAQPWL